MPESVDAPVPLGPMAAAVEVSLSAVKVTGDLAAAAALARVYAAQLDAAPQLVGKLGPQLHAVLQSLGLTRSTAVPVAGAPAAVGPAPTQRAAALAELREAARERASASA